VKEIFDHPWFRNFENLELEKAKKNQEPFERVPSKNIKISEFDYNSNQKPEINNNNNKIIISKQNIIVKNSKKTSSNSSLINCENVIINQESNPNPIDSYKSSSAGFNLIPENIHPPIQNLISAQSKNKVNLKDLKKENLADEVLGINGIIDNNNNRKNKSNDNSVLIGLGKKPHEESKSHTNSKDNIKNKASLDSYSDKVENYKNNSSNKDCETIETPENPNQGKTKMIIKKKKKILISKTPTYSENLTSNEPVGKHSLPESPENNFIENYKAAKINSVLKKNNSIIKEPNNKSELSIRNNVKENSYLDSYNDFKSNANKLSSDINRIDTQNLNDLKSAKNSSNKIQFASEQIANNKLKTNNNNKSSNKTSNDILLEGLSPVNKYNNNNYKKPYENFNIDNKSNFDFTEGGGYDLENFIQQQNSKKSKIGSSNNNNIGNGNNFKSPVYKDSGKFFEKKYNTKSNIENNHSNTNNNNNSATEFNNDNLDINKFQNNYFANNASDDYDSEDQNKFSNLIKMKNAAVQNKKKIDRSMDRSFNEISRDQIQEKINYKKNKSIMNALNKTENDVEKFDNNQMNSSVIDVVFSKIEGKNKNKNKNNNKEYGVCFYLVFKFNFLKFPFFMKFN